MRIGLVMPAFNAAPWVGDAVASVIAQTHRDWALVVVDDGSTDATTDVVGSFADPRIRLIRQSNAGVSAARNRGMAQLVGTTPTPALPRFAGEGWGGGLLFLDADDWLAPDALVRLADALDASPDAIAAVGGYTFVDTGDTRQPHSGELLERLLVGNLFANGGHLLLRGSVVQAAGGFLPGLAYGEDWEFWIRVALQGPFVAASGTAPVLFVRQYPGGAYHRLASDPSAFAPCMEAIFRNPVLHSCFTRHELTRIRRRTDAENHWIIGRELIRHGRRGDGKAWLRRSVHANPTARRLALLAIAHVLPLLPPVLRAPFQAYRQTAAKQASRTQSFTKCTQSCTEKQTNGASRGVH